MRRQLFFLLAFLSFIILVIRFSLQPITDYLGLKARSGLEIEANKQAKVLINNKEVGQTPFKSENLTEGEVDLKLIPLESSASSWEKKVKLNAGTITVVNRELEEDSKYSSGEVITLEKGQGVTIVTNPAGASVSIDGQVKGQTPLTVSGLGEGDKQFLINKENYLKRSLRATLKEGYMLTLSVDLALAEIEIPQSTPIPVVKKQEVVVEGTPNGFLRVRAEPSTSGKEVVRVKEGDTLEVLAEEDEWFKVKTSDGKEGYVSSEYVEVKEE